MDNPAMHRLPRAARAALPLVLGAALLLGAGAADAQCAMCGTVGQGAKDPLVHGMFRSILFMVSMPFVLVGSVGCWFVHEYRKAAQPAEPGTVAAADNEEKPR